MTSIDLVLGSPDAKILADSVANKYTHVVYAYWHTVEVNFLRLATQLDQHVLYGMRDDWAHVPIAAIYHRIEVNAALINFLDSYHGLSDCQQAIKNRVISDEEFNIWYNESITAFPLVNKILNKIRQKIHHAEGPELIFRKIMDSGPAVSFEKDVGFDVPKLLKLCDLNIEEQEYFAKLDFFDLRKATIESFNALRIFNTQYKDQLRQLIRRKTGFDIHLTIN